jgi:dipeptidase E
MKLLLTSAGITKRAIADTLVELVGKPASSTKVAFIPTAANVEEGNKDWYINQFLNFWRFGFNWIDVVDPSAPDVAWQERLRDVDVVFVSGGNTFHLLNQMRMTGLQKWLNENMQTKVYVGVSAGTIVAAPTIGVANMPPPDSNVAGLKDLSGLGWVDFEIEPHCDKDRYALVEQYAQKCPYPVYGIDDQTAIKVAGGKAEVVSEGFWKLFD